MICSITGLQCPTKKLKIVDQNDNVDYLNVSEQILYNEGLLDIPYLTLPEYIELMEEYNVPISSWE